MFIPHEAKEKIDNLEQEVKKLKAENLNLKKEGNKEQSASTTEEIKKLKAEILALRKKAAESSKDSSPAGVIILGVLLIISLFVNVYLYMYPVTPVLEDNTAYVDSVSFYWDNQIVKMSTMPEEGIVYRVQIGAYQEYNLENYKINLDGLGQDTSNAEFTKMVLGGFSNVLDAQEFQQQMARLGLETAYIVAFKDGAPIGVLESEIESTNSDTID
ncbi:MAG: hypothetical protein N4A46_12830 [Schleiferiaceae bacterium]|jgi:hypothetical protein|nr:hypothetical protein [Schleiferiaceae bacterium]